MWETIVGYVQALVPGIDASKTIIGVIVTFLGFLVSSSGNGSAEDPLIGMALLIGGFVTILVGVGAIDINDLFAQ